MARTEIDIWVTDFFNVDLTSYPAPEEKKGGHHRQAGHQQGEHGHHGHGHRPEHHDKQRPPEVLEIDIELAPAPNDEQPASLAEPPEQPANGADAAPASREESIGSLNIPGIPIPIPTPDPFKHCIVNGKLLNKTSQTLKLGGKHTTSGDITENPPGEILPKSEDEEFRAESGFPHLFKGAVGSMDYAIDDQGTKWNLTWSIPRVGDNKATGAVTGPNKDKYHSTAHSGSQAEAEFKYVLVEKGGGDKPDTPGADANCTCMVTVTNNTQVPLALAHQGHDHGDFMTFPPTSIAPGASGSFVSTQTPHGKVPGCKGFVVWEAGEPVAVTWRVEWDNAVKEKNTAQALLDPQSAGFKSVEQIGQGDENVPVAFTLSGGSGGGNGPGPKPVEPEPAFEPPEKPKQPTLRKGDKNSDGWVEYAQELLNFHLKSNLAIDGDFGNGTFKAVQQFQKAKKLSIVDGIIGNETWAALRKGAPEKAGTDGRKPHTFEETGKQARFTVESSDNCVFDAKPNLFRMVVVATGEQPIDANKATIRVTQPDGTKKTVAVVIGKSVAAPPDGQGASHVVQIEKFTEVFKIANPALVPECLIEAYLDKEIGGDNFSGHPTVR